MGVAQRADALAGDDAAQLSCSANAGCAKVALVGRRLFPLLLLGLALPGAAQAADWAVVKGERACTTQVTLTARRTPDQTLQIIADGETSRIRIVPPEGAELRRLQVGPKRFTPKVQSVEAAVEAPLDDELIDALAKGRRISVTWSKGRAASGSLTGSAAALERLKDCAAEVRLARSGVLAPENLAEIGAFEPGAETTTFRQAALAEARARYQREVLAVLGAGVLGAGEVAPPTRTYTFEGTEPIVCSASLESFDCR